jgi:geranylgeranyl diphosphate synthase, type II
MGAIIANENETNQALLYDFGVNVGIAFQIQDDLLDLFANPENFGKQVGGDILADKKTILSLKAIEQVGEDRVYAFKKSIENLEKEEKVAQTKVFFEEIGVKEQVILIRDAYFDKAEFALNEIQVADEHKKNLRFLIEFLKEREV